MGYKRRAPRQEWTTEREAIVYIDYRITGLASLLVVVGAEHSSGNGGKDFPQAGRASL